MFKPEDFDIIDMHVHPFESSNTLLRHFTQTDNMDDFVREMRKAGVKKFAGSVISLPLRQVDFNEIKRLNRIALQLRDKYPEYIPGIHIHGDYVEESCQELHDMKAEGVKFVGELVPYILGTWEYGSDNALEIFKEAEKLQMPVNLHGGEEHELTRVLTTCPNLNIILAHPGETAEAKQRFDFVSRYRNLYMDISGTGLFRWGMLRYAVDVCGAEKILLGSDMPICSVAMQVYGVLAENLTREECQKIFADNFRYLIGE